MVLFGELADTSKQLINLLHQRADERTVFAWKQGEEFLKRNAFRPAQGPCQLALVNSTSAPGVLDDAALGFDSRNGIQD